jgi:hypothetical protein
MGHRLRDRLAEILFEMNGEKNLVILLRSLEPKLNDGEYVYCKIDPESSFDLTEVVGTFLEPEGLTVILRRELADSKGWPYTFVAAWITLTVHSALDAVGLTAAFANALAKERISCNVVAGVHHDHIFVGVEDANRAMAALNSLARG